MRRALIAVLAVSSILLAVALVPPAREAVEQAMTPPRAAVLFGGDMMFDRSIRQYAAAKGGDYLFSCIDGVLSREDFVVANLEGPITERPSVSLGTAPGGHGNYTFTFPTSTAALLAAHRIGAVDLGNNHIYNFEAAGVRSTMLALRAGGVGYFGDPLTNAPLEKDINSVPIAFVSYNEFLPPGMGTAPTTLAQIQEEKAKGFLPVVYAHWGVEYQETAPGYVAALAHAFVDAGAAAVIGSHPHVVENSETYKGAPVYYSLGNFIFDQYWGSAVTHGLLVELTFNAKGVFAAREIPIVLSRDRRVCPAR